MLASIESPLSVIFSARSGRLTHAAPPTVGLILPMPRQAPIRCSVKILSSDILWIERAGGIRPTLRFGDVGRVISCIRNNQYLLMNFLKLLEFLTVLEILNKIRENAKRCFLYLS
jgi:hypothetical protein